MGDDASHSNGRVLSTKREQRMSQPNLRIISLRFDRNEGGKAQDKKSLFANAVKSTRRTERSDVLTGLSSSIVGNCLASGVLTANGLIGSQLESVADGVQYSLSLVCGLRVWVNLVQL